MAADIFCHHPPIDYLIGPLDRYRSSYFVTLRSYTSLVVEILDFGLYMNSKMLNLSGYHVLVYLYGGYDVQITGR